MGQESEYNGLQLVVVMIIALCFTYFSVLLRCYVRIQIQRSFQIDDWMMLISLMGFTLSCSFIFVGIHWGIGRHNSSLSMPNMTEALKYQALTKLSYIANMMFIKISIAIFLLRFAVEDSYKWILRISMVVVSIWSTAIFFYCIFQCRPVASQWDYTLEANCVSGPSFAAVAYSFSVMTIATDWLYALLPIPMIWSMQMDIRSKITVVFLLGLGIFASVATLIRLKYIIELTDWTDVLFGGTTAITWTLIEPSVAITASSLVTLRPLLKALHLCGFEREGQDTNPRAARRGSRRLRQEIPDGNWTISSFRSTGESKETRSSRAMEMAESRARDLRERVGSNAGSEVYIIEEGGIITVFARVEPVEIYSNS